MRHEQTIVYQKARAFRAAREDSIEVGKALALDLVRMISKFDSGRGRQGSETGRRAQVAGDRIQVVRHQDDDLDS